MIHSGLTKWYRLNSRYLSPSFLNSSNLTQNETLVRLHHFFRVMLATRPFSQTIRKMREDPYLFPLFLVQHKVYDLSRADRAWIIAAYKLGWPIFVYNYYLLVSLIATSREKLGRRCFDIGRFGDQEYFWRLTSTAKKFYREHWSNLDLVVSK